MPNEYSIAEAKNSLPAIIHDVEKGPHVKLTRRGKPVAILLSMSEFEKMNRENRQFWSALQNIRKNINNGKIDIGETDFIGLRDKSTGREVSYDG